MSLNKPSWMNSDTWSQFIAKWSSSPQCNHPGCIKPADTVDHIVARRNNGPDEIENLQPLCREHNSKKGIKPDEYWSKTFFFDHPRINLDKLRTAQKREGWDRILDYKDWFLHPWNQINRTIYGNFWIVGAGKTLAPVVQACALNYITALCATNWYSSSSEKNSFGVVGWSIRGLLVTTVGLLPKYFSVKTS